MNLGLVTSYIIGGIILLSILAMNMSLSSSSTEITLTQVTREKASSVSEMIAHDVQKMGYNREEKTNTIIERAKEQEIIFHSNINNSEDNTVEKITWKFEKANDIEVISTNNPNDYMLMRIVQDQAGNIIDETQIGAGVTDFLIRYYDEYGKPVNEYMSDSNGNLTNIKQLYIRLALESGEKVYQNSGGEGRYIRSVWEKRFSPPNLEDNNS